LEKKGKINTFFVEIQNLVRIFEEKKSKITKELRSDKGRSLEE
jgi:hypothetical protein